MFRFLVWLFLFCGFAANAAYVPPAGSNVSGAIVTATGGPTRTLATWMVNLIGAQNNVGLSNVAYGVNALQGNTTGSNNTASGLNALQGNTTGSYNTASGLNTLQGNTTGIYNTASGVNALFGNTTGSNNTASGLNALFTNTTGSYNTASGVNALQGNTTGINNTASGVNALFGNTTGGSNTVIGYNSGLSIIAGSGNIMVGNGADSGSDTSNQINLGNLVYYNNASTSAPAVTSCGSSPSIDAHANNRSGTVTVGTGVIATCTITFAGSGYTTWNHCRVTSQLSEAAFAYSYTKTALTVTATSLTSNKLDYDCDGF